MAERKEEEPREVEIRFGTLFRPRIGGELILDKTKVVTDVEEGDSFGSAMVVEKDGAKFIIWISSGSQPLNHLGEIIGELSEEEVLEAWERGYDQELGEILTPERLEEAKKVLRINLEKSAQKGPRKIRIKS